MNGQTTDAGPGGEAGFTGAVKAEAGHLKEVVQEEAGQTGAKLKEEAQAALTGLKGAGQRLAESRKNLLSAKTEEFATAVSAAAERLRDGETPNPLAGPAESAARSLEQLAGYLKDHEPGDILDGLGHWARRRPELVFGGLFLAGLVGARFLKASSKPSSNDGSSNRQDTDALYDRWASRARQDSWKGELSSSEGGTGSGDSRNVPESNNPGSTAPLPNRPPSYSDADPVYPGSEPSPATQVYNPALP